MAGFGLQVAPHSRQLLADMLNFMGFRTAPLWADGEFVWNGPKTCPSRQAQARRRQG